MVRKRLKLISVVLTAVALISLAAVPYHAVTLFTDGAYTYADVDEYNVALYDYDTTESSVLVMPSSYNGKFVSSVYAYAFEDNSTITQIDFSHASRRLESIDMKAFHNCTGLTGELVLPSSIRTLGLGAFQSCTNISSVTLNCTTKEIPIQCFNRCSSLTTVYLPISAERIENLAFANCPYLDDVYFTTNVNYISETAFMNSNYVRFHVWYGSYAYQYAIDNHIPYTLLDGVKLGDSDGDGSVNVSDVTKIQRYLAELETLEGIYLRAADANQDGTVDISDATALQMYIAEYDLPYPIGEAITQ